jgi:hypothetical protein
MFEQLAAKFKQSMDPSAFPPELQPINPPVGLDPRRCAQTVINLTMHKPVCMGLETEYRVMEQAGQMVIHAMSSLTGVDTGQLVLHLVRRQC